MKTFLISLLMLALVAAAFMTRPGKRDFMLYLLDQRVPPTGSWTQGDIDAADSAARAVKFKNRLLWTSIEKDGKTVYVGVFSHWFIKGEGLEMPAPTAAEAAALSKAARASVN